MSWEDVEPVIKTTGNPMVSASVRVTSTGKTSVFINMADTFLKELGIRCENDKTAKVQFGKDENEGKVRIAFGPGKFSARYPAKGGCVLQLPPTRYTPDFSQGKEPCSYEVLGDKAVIVTLPKASWLAAISARTKSKAPPSPSPNMKPVTSILEDRPAVPDKHRLDAIKYLTKKGCKIAPLRDGWLLDDKNVGIEEIVTKINWFRTRESLGPITAAQITI